MDIDRLLNTKAVYCRNLANAERDAIERVENALCTHGDFGVYGNLSGGLESITKDLAVTITGREDSFFVDALPFSGEGHGFTFIVSKTTGEIGDLIVETLEPEPDWEEEDEGGIG